MAAQWVDGQAIAEGLAQEAQVAGAEDHVVGVVHHGDFRAVAQVILKGVQADLVDQLQQAAAVGAGAPHRDHLFGEVAVEITLQRTLEERREAGAFGNRVLGWDDQAAAVDQVRGEGDIRRREAERGADQHRHLLVGQVLLGALEVVEQGVVEVDVAFLLEVAGQLVQHQFIEGGAVVDALDLGLHQFVEVGDGGVEVDRRVEQQHFLEVEAAAGFVQLADERRVQRAQAVAGEVEVGDGQRGILRAYGLHHAVHVLGVFLGDAGRGKARGGADEVEAGGR